MTVSNQTLRQIVRTSVGGSRVRVVLSNAFGTSPVAIGAADIAPRSSEASIAASAARPITFGGSPTATVLPGAVLVSDPIEMAVAPLSDLVVDLYLPGELGIGPSPVTVHNGASQTNYLSQAGDHTGAAMLPMPTRTGAWFLLARIEVAAPAGAAAVVAFGDSITDGARSTVDTNNRWPDHLARRLAAAGRPVAVLNAGISGNRVLSDGAGVSALARFDKDVLMQTGVTHVVVMEGINDIGLARDNPSPSAADIIAGHKQLIERARARGLKVYGATLTPFEGARVLHARGRGQAAGGQRVDSHQQGLRRRHRLRRGDARPLGAGPLPPGLRFRRPPAPRRRRLQGDGRGRGRGAVSLTSASGFRLPASND